MPDHSPGALGGSIRRVVLGRHRAGTGVLVYQDLYLVYQHRHASSLP